MGQAISEGFMRAGFAMLGGGLAQQFDNPELAKMGREQGEAIVQTLRDEWWQKQAENFRQMHGKRFQEQMQSLQAEYERKTELHTLRTGDIDPNTGEPIQIMGFVPTDYEGAPKPGDLIKADSLEAYHHLQQAAEDFYRQTGQLSMSFLDTAGQYPNNPHINQMANGLVQFMNQQAGYAATGRREAQEQLGYMQEQEAGRVQRATANEEYIKAVTDRETRAAAMKAAVEEARIEAAANDQFRGALDMAGLPSNPKKWNKEQGAQAAALLERMRREETRRAELLRKSPFERMTNIIPPTTPLENVGSALETTKLHEASLETATQDVASRLENVISTSDLPQFKQIREDIEATALDPTSKQKAMEAAINNLLTSPQYRTEVKRLALRDSMTKAYALDPQFRARVDSTVQRKLGAGDWKRYEGESNLDVFMDHQYDHLLPVNPQTGKQFQNRGELIEWKRKREEAARQEAIKSAQEKIDQEKKQKKERDRFRFTAAGEAAGVERYRELTQAINQIEQAMQSAQGREYQQMERLARKLRNERDKYPSPAGSLLRRGAELFRGARAESEVEAEQRRQEALETARGLLTR